MHNLKLKSGSPITKRMCHSSIMKRLILLGAVTMSLVVLPTRAEESETLFNQKCASCHAKDGSGHTPAAAKMTIPDFKSKPIRDRSDAELTDSIANGTKHYAYPHAFLHTGMTSDQIAGLVKYIRTLQSDKKSPEKK